MNGERHPEFDGQPEPDMAPLPPFLTAPTRYGREIEVRIGNESCVSIFEHDGRGLALVTFSKHDREIGMGIAMDAKYLDRLADLMKATAEKLRDGSWREEKANG